KVKQWMRKGFSILGDVSGRLIPPDDVEFSAERVFVISGDKVRYESFGPEWNSTKEAYTPFRFLTIWDGTRSIRFQDPEGFWSGRIENSRFIVGLSALDPLVWTYRMFDREWARIDLSEFVVRPTIDDIDGEACVVVERSRPSRATLDEPLVERMWLSCNQQYVIRRYEFGRGTWVGDRLDIEYDDAPQGIPVPIRWTKAEGLHGDPAPGAIGVSEISNFELNVAIDAKAFQFEFPVNTWVTEVGDDDPYIVREDGSHRSITQSELDRGATYDDILATPSGQAKLTPITRSARVWLFWTVQAVLGVGILAYLCRTRLTRNS
ncbi:MAG: hypothetical protein AB7U20_24985, partial [Planctomycetaceae bacterium]